MFSIVNFQYKDDLATDEEIFAERTKENDSLRQHIKELENDNVNLSDQLKDVLEKLKKYDDQLLRQQVQLNKQMFPKENEATAEELGTKWLIWWHVKHFESF